MMTNVINTVARVGVTMVGFLLTIIAIPAWGDEPTSPQPPAVPVAITQDVAILQDAVIPQDVDSDAVDSAEDYGALHSLPENWKSHPLAPALMLARQRGEHLREHVKDFTCLLIKRERINGQLRDYEYLATKVRREQRAGDRVTSPYAVYSLYLGPAKFRGRQVLYVAGENDGKILVRNGGKRFNYITVKLEPDSAAAMRESRYPITELGIEALTQRLIDQTLSDIRNDPAGENSEVTFFREASVNNRSCLHIRVTHPAQLDKFVYHQANIYIDDELQMPIRVETFDWPKDDEKVLEEEYTLTRLKLNVGLTDADFSPAVLEEKVSDDKNIARRDVERKAVDRATIAAERSNDN